MSKTNPYKIQNNRNSLTDKRYNDYSSYLKMKFGERVQKITINAGFTCPNRDGKIGTGGCTYCNNNSFSPEYCKPKKSVSQQIEEGINFFSMKYKSQKYLAYFQSYSNTYDEIEKLKTLYSEALNFPNVIGLVIATRPDCVNDEILNYLSELNKSAYISLEYGIESTHNETLKNINRGHLYEDSVEAIIKTAEKNIDICGHLILGLPGESKELMLSHADKISKLPLNQLKIHQLQIIKQTVMASQFNKTPETFNLFKINDYIEFIVDFLERLNPNISIERFVSQSPSNLLISPKWDIKNFEIVNMIEKKLKERNTWQGRLVS